MKKIIYNIVLLVMLSLTAKTYSQSWNGVPISGSFINFKANMLAKGFKMTTKEESSAVFEGKINGTEYEVISYCTPISNQVASLSIYLPKKQSWDNLKSEYKYVKDLMNEKYGLPEEYEYFVSPYYEGDGYEITAVVNEKCKFSAYWLNIRNEPNMSIMTEISKYQQVKINYQNNENMEKATQERKNLNKKVF